MNYVYISSVVMTCNAIFLKPNFGQKKTDRRPQEIIFQRSWILGKPKKNSRKPRKTKKQKQKKQFSETLGWTGLGFWENKKLEKAKKKLKKNNFQRLLAGHPNSTRPLDFFFVFSRFLLFSQNPVPIQPRVSENCFLYFFWFSQFFDPPPGTPPGLPPPTPPLEVTPHISTMVPMTPPELLDPSPRTPESQ